MSTDYELFKAFLGQSGVACDEADSAFGRCVLFVGEDRGDKVDGHGSLEVLFNADGSLRDFCFWD